MFIIPIRVRPRSPFDENSTKVRRERPSCVSVKFDSSRGCETSVSRRRTHPHDTCPSESITSARLRPAAACRVMRPASTVRTPLSRRPASPNAVCNRLSSSPAMLDSLRTAAGPNVTLRIGTRDDPPVVPTGWLLPAPAVWPPARRCPRLTSTRNRQATPNVIRRLPVPGVLDRCLRVRGRRPACPQHAQLLTTGTGTRAAYRSANAVAAGRLLVPSGLSTPPRYGLLPSHRADADRPGGTNWHARQRREAPARLYSFRTTGAITMCARWQARCADRAIRADYAAPSFS